MHALVPSRCPQPWRPFSGPPPPPEHEPKVADSGRTTSALAASHAAGSAVVYEGTAIPVPTVSKLSFKNPPTSLPTKAVSCKPLTVKAPPPRPPCPVRALPSPVLPDPAIVMQLLQAMEQAEELFRQNNGVPLSGAAQMSADPLPRLDAFTDSQQLGNVASAANSADVVLSEKGTCRQQLVDVCLGCWEFLDL